MVQREIETWCRVVSYTKQSDLGPIPAAASRAGTNFLLPMVRLRLGLTVAMSAGSTGKDSSK